MMCQSQMVLFYLSRSMHRFVRPPKLYRKLILHEGC